MDFEKSEIKIIDNLNGEICYFEMNENKEINIIKKYICHFFNIIDCKLYFSNNNMHRLKYNLVALIDNILMPFYINKFYELYYDDKFLFFSKHTKSINKKSLLCYKNYKDIMDFKNDHMDFLNIFNKKHINVHKIKDKNFINAFKIIEKEFKLIKGLNNFW